jgi:hypothetical protein
MNKPIFENIFRSSEVSFNDEGIAVCPYCNGTGLNDDFELLNKYHEFTNFPVRAHCLKCYGKKKTDWVEVLNSRIDDEMDALFHDNLGILFSGFLAFLRFVYIGYRHESNDEEYYQYDNDKNQWVESELNDWPGHLECKKEMLIWINKLIDAGYMRDPGDPEEFTKNCLSSASIPDILSLIYDPICDSECAANIKAGILYTTELKIDNLLQIRKDLEILGYTIEDLNEIASDDESTDNFDVDFVFTWENLLDKFKIPRLHKYSPLPDGVLTVD